MAAGLLPQPVITDAAESFIHLAGKGTLAKDKLFSGAVAWLDLVAAERGTVSNKELRKT